MLILPECMRAHRSCCSIFRFLYSVLKIVVYPSGQTKDHKTIRFVFTSSCLSAGSYLIYVICVCLRIVVSNTHCVVFCFVCLRFVYPMLPISLDCPFLIASSIFSNVSAIKGIEYQTSKSEYYFVY